MTKLLDIVYTPLDCPPMPTIQISAVRDWIKRTHNNEQQMILKNYYNNKTGEKHYGEKYPWNLTFAKWEMWDHQWGWLNNFDNEFPVLSTYLYEAFGVLNEEIGHVSLLPTKDNFTGIGFWHNDLDNFGLRMYLEFEHLNENKLLMKKTKLPNVKLKDYGFSKEYNYKSDELQDEVLECKMVSSTQCFYINNVRSVHTTYTAKPGNRIAVFVSPKPSCNKIVWEKTEDLVYRSAQKFKDYAIFY